MNDVALQLLTGAVGGAIMTSLIGPFIMRYQDRRKTKADVLRALYRVEVSRWASKKHTYETYVADVHDLQAAALIARAYRPLIDLYVESSAIARSGSDDDFETDNDSDFAGRIDSDIADYTSRVARVLSDYLWHPYLYRIVVKTKIDELKKNRVALKRKYTRGTSSSTHIYNWDRSF